jgi:predicted tellurium resistance membrane protein TerC
MLARMIDRFIYLKTGLALVLFFVGTKMIIARHLAIPNWISLLIILTILVVTITVSLVVTKRRARNASTPPPGAE